MDIAACLSMHMFRSVTLAGGTLVLQGTSVHLCECVTHLSESWSPVLAPLR
jgi:hypothetical protein